ncbi:unnamed protein product [Caenorhabditis auriculariae]|uniref:Uncharacterized protein n=1 Tax=Caenorhabditis auriculariae TaxID=2777116 RepID=A0A8S1HF47_9PELO|nr:unnamed protein product [Caenorhabditis auriculariae]
MTLVAPLLSDLGVHTDKPNVDSGPTYEAALFLLALLGLKDDQSAPDDERPLELGSLEMPHTSTYAAHSSCPSSATLPFAVSFHSVYRNPQYRLKHWPRYRGSSLRLYGMATSTVLPILCLMDWQSPECRLHAQPPRFASNFDASRLATRRPKPTLDATLPTSNESFFSPVLPSSATSIQPRSSSTTTTEKPRGRSSQAVTQRATSTTTTATSTSSFITVTTAASTVTSTRMSDQVVFLSELTAEVEASADDDFGRLQATAVTQPLRTTSTPAWRRPAPTNATPLVTVLPRPYNSIEEAEQNPDYWGSSIWNNVDALPEPMVTGPAWRTRRPINATASAATEKLTTKQTTTSAVVKTTARAATRSISTITFTTTTTKRPITSRKANGWQMSSDCCLLDTLSRPPACLVSPECASVVAVSRKDVQICLSEVSSTVLTTATSVAATTRLKATPPYTVYPVRPTTPMGGPAPTTMQMPIETTTDFPRTALIMGSSLTVILAIAAVVFFVFKCRQTPPSSEHYPMTMNTKSQAGYTAISSQLSPQLNERNECTQPLLSRPQVNGNGYQPLNGAVISNGNHTNGVNGGVRSATIPRNGAPPAKKKDFKEWYV